MSHPADDITDRLVERARDGMEKVAQELEQRWRQMVSVPVEGVGRSAIRSKPGEPPRRDTGEYQDSIDHRTSVEGDKVIAVAGTSMERGVWLEKGTGRMRPRPHASKLAEEFGGEIVERVAEAIGDAVTA
jgi:hypothetical protein